MEHPISNVPVKIIAEHPDLIPKYETAGAAGFDFKANIPAPITLMPGEIKLIPTGLKMAIAPGFEIQVRPRSGLSTKGISVANSPGTLDEDFRGEIKIIIRNDRIACDEDSGAYTISPMDRIAQGVLARVPKAHFIVVESLDSTDRGEGGFGHTGS